MDLKITPSFFYGAAGSAAAGLVLGLALHGPWGAFDGARAPQILFPSAQAAEAASSDTVAAAADEQADPATLYAGYLPPTPQPVVRLAGEKSDAMQAAAEAANREDTETALREAGVIQPAAEPAAPPPAAGEGTLQGQPEAMKADAAPDQ